MIKIIKNRDGIVISEENWLNDQLNGLCKYYNDHGQLNQEIHYVNSVPCGWETSYFESGPIQSKILWCGTNDLSEFLSFYENGNPQSKYTRILKSASPFERDRFTVALYYDNSQLAETGELLISPIRSDFSGGRADGKWMAYARDGKVIGIREYEKGIKTGVWQEFKEGVVTLTSFQDDRPIKIVKKDELTSEIIESTQYHSDGSVKRE